MALFKDIATGISSCYQATPFIFKNGLWWYFLIPALLSGAVYLGGDLLVAELESVRFSDIPNDDQREFNFLFIGIKAILVFVALKLNPYVVLLILVPMLANLSTRTEKILTANSYPFRLKQFGSDITRGITIALRNIFRQSIIILCWFVATLVYSPLQVATPYVIFCVGFYFYGFSLVDYTNERRRLDIIESVKFVRSHVGLVIAIGAVFSLLFIIPYAGVVVAPVIAIVGATIAMHKTVDLSKNKAAQNLAKA